MKLPSTPTWAGAKRAAAGFTLIELMITVAVVAILTGVAYPSYIDHIVRSRRATAALCLHEHAQFLERFNALNMRYDLDVNNAAVALPQLACANDLNSSQVIYNFALPNVNATTFTVNATPQGHQAAKDTKCATLTLDQAGARTHSGSGTAAECWR